MYVVEMQGLKFTITKKESIKIRLDTKVVIELVSIKSEIDLFQTGHLLSRR